MLQSIFSLLYATFLRAKVNINYAQKVRFSKFIC